LPSRRLLWAQPRLFFWTRTCLGNVKMIHHLVLLLCCCNYSSILQVSNLHSFFNCVFVCSTVL
jgi:hypothetical protein